MEEKQDDVDFRNLPETRGAVLIRDGRKDELSQEELRAVTHLFDLPAEKESLDIIEDLFTRLNDVVQETGTHVEAYEEDGLHFLVFTPSTEGNVAE